MTVTYLEISLLAKSHLEMFEDEPSICTQSTTVF